MKKQLHIKYKQHVNLVVRNTYHQFYRTVDNRPDWSATETSQTLELSNVETKGVILCRLKNAGDDFDVLLTLR